jgi:hypothetical protein
MLQGLYILSYSLITMLAQALLPIALAFFTPLVQAKAGIAEVCEEYKVVSEWYIGENKDVLVEEIECLSGLAKSNSLVGRQTNSNVCGAQCKGLILCDLTYWTEVLVGNTSCFRDGTAPVANDCHVIADALRYESQNNATFPIPRVGHHGLFNRRLCD